MVVEGIKPEGQRISKQELEMARKLIESYTAPWKPKQYEDTYHDDLLAAIEAKERGGEVAEVAVPEEEAAPDLMEALRRSVESAAARPRRRRRSSSAGRSATKTTR